MKKKISIIVPTYNEEGNVEALYKRLVTVLLHHPYDREILFVDNFSQDSTLDQLKKIQKKDKKVIIITLSRNFGSSQPSYLLGLKECSGDCAVLIDGDLQDPPEVIHQFIAKWEEGYDVVYGIRTARKGSIARRIGYKIFYRIFRMVSDIPIAVDVGDFSLIDKKVIRQMRRIPEQDYYVRSIRAYVGFKQTGVSYTREERHMGTSHLPFWGNFFWAKHAIVSFSSKPLEFISIVSLLIAFVSFCSIIFYFYLYLFTENRPQGIATIITLILFLGSIQLLAISILAEYLSKIFIEIKRRPNAIVDKIYKIK